MSEYSEYAEYAWNELKKHIQAGETFVEGVEKDVAVLTARLIDAARRAENAVLAAIEGEDDASASDTPAATPDTVGATPDTVGVDANGSPVSEPVSEPVVDGSVTKT